MVKEKINKEKKRGEKKRGTGTVLEKERQKEAEVK